MWGLSRCRPHCTYGEKCLWLVGITAGTEEAEDYLLGKLQRDHTPRLSFYTLSPKFEFGVNGAVEHKILLEALSLEGTDWGVMANLLRHPPEAQIFSSEWGKFQFQKDKKKKKKIRVETCECEILWSSDPSPDELKGLSQ